MIFQHLIYLIFSQVSDTQVQILLALFIKRLLISVVTLSNKFVKILSKFLLNLLEVADIVKTEATHTKLLLLSFQDQLTSFA